MKLFTGPIFLFFIKEGTNPELKNSLNPGTLPFKFHGWNECDSVGELLIPTKIFFPLRSLFDEESF